MVILKSLRTLYGRARKSLELRQYTPDTIAEYFRKMGAQIGKGCFIVPTDLGTEPYLIKIGNHVAIAAEVTFATHDGAVWVFRDDVPDLQVFGPIVIEDNCIIGLRAIIFPNVRIGRNSVVAAGSLVINDVPPNSVVMGVPARSFGSMEKYREKCLQRWAQQRPPDVTFGEGETWWNSPRSAANRARLREHLLSVFRDLLQSDGPVESTGQGGDRDCVDKRKRAHSDEAKNEPSSTAEPELSRTD